MSLLTARHLVKIRPIEIESIIISWLPKARVLCKIGVRYSERRTKNVRRKRLAVTAMAEVPWEGCTPTFLESYLLFHAELSSSCNAPIQSIFTF